MVTAVSDYEAELRRLEAMAEKLEFEAIGSASSAARRAGCLFQRAMLSGSLDECLEVARLVDAELARHPVWPDLWLVKAMVDFHLHRFDQARRDLHELARLADCGERRAMAADIDLEEGRVEEAEQVYRRILLDEPSWRNFWRLANCLAHEGRLDAAAALLARAAEEITAKEMRTFAWLQVQWGDMELHAGHPARARRRYELADASFSGYWLVQERLAGLSR